MSEQEMQNLSDQVFTHVQDLLEKCILEVLYQTGIRKSELCGMTFENVNLDAGEIKIIGKGNKQRVIPISENLAAVLKVTYKSANRQQNLNHTSLSTGKVKTHRKICLFGG